jgi:hypothetical protein
MENYIHQLLGDIRHSIDQFSSSEPSSSFEIWDWKSFEEEEQNAPTRSLEDWTGIQQIMLPPENRLSDAQLTSILNALEELLDVYNWCFVLQFNVPERIQYETIRLNFNQEAKVKTWHLGFFEFCAPNTEHRKCALGEYCNCAYFDDMLSKFKPDTRTPEEQRAAHLEIEVNHIKWKHGDDWMNYYPYHLDAAHDDENGNPYDYGFGDSDDEEDEADNWWRK